jgi:hypothetical protein
VRPLSRGVAIALALIASVFSHPAWALCPNCLGQSPNVSTTLAIVGVFLLVPFAVFFAVAVAVKKIASSGGSEPLEGSDEVSRHSRHSLPSGGRSGV